MCSTAEWHRWAASVAGYFFISHERSTKNAFPHSPSNDDGCGLRINSPKIYINGQTEMFLFASSIYCSRWMCTCAHSLLANGCSRSFFTWNVFLHRTSYCFIAIRRRLQCIAHIKCAACLSIASSRERDGWLLLMEQIVGSCYRPRRRWLFHHSPVMARLGIARTCFHSILMDCNSYSLFCYFVPRYSFVCLPPSPLAVRLRWNMCEAANKCRCGRIVGLAYGRFRAREFNLNGRPASRQLPLTHVIYLLIAIWSSYSIFFIHPIRLRRLIRTFPYQIGNFCFVLCLRFEFVYCPF